MVDFLFFFIYIACGLYKAEYQNNHDDGSGVSFFLLGRVFASRLIKAHEEKKREKDLISISEPMDRRDCLHLFTK